MRSLIIADLHNRIDWVKTCLLQEDWDEVILLGDYFDNFHDTTEDAIKTAKWLKSMIEIKKKSDVDRLHLLLGNHDLYYLFPFNWPYVSAGFTHEKNRAIRNILHEEDWKHLELYKVSLDGFLCSHAGFHNNFWKQDGPINLEGIKVILDKAREDLGSGIVNSILLPGWDRCGPKAPNVVGGITWQDWDSLEPIPNVNQIVGHTPSRYIRRQVNKFSRNYCLDTACRHFAIIDNGHLIIKENKYYEQTLRR